MKTKIIAAALVAVMCVVPFTGCGCGKQKSVVSSTSQASLQTDSFSYEIAGVEFTSKVDVNSFVKGDVYDMDGLAAASQYEKTNKDDTWTIAKDGVRYNVALIDEKDGAYTGVSITTSTMDGKKKTVSGRYEVSKDDKIYTLNNKKKIPYTGILLANYVFENGPGAIESDPFKGAFDEFKNDKGDYTLTASAAATTTAAAEKAAETTNAAETTKAAESVN